MNPNSVEVTAYLMLLKKDISELKIIPYTSSFTVSKNPKWNRLFKWLLCYFNAFGKRIMIISIFEGTRYKVVYRDSYVITLAFVFYGLHPISLTGPAITGLWLLLEYQP